VRKLLNLGCGKETMVSVKALVYVVASIFLFLVLMSVVYIAIFSGIAATNVEDPLTSFITLFFVVLFAGVLLVSIPNFAIMYMVREK
jgi:hypothetical protein